jgi:hypothetical protein
MGTKIENKYPIYLDSYISDIEKEKKVFPQNKIKASMTGAAESFENFNTLKVRSKGRLEIPKDYFYNGILESDSLTNFVRGNSFYIRPGEYECTGDLNYLNYQNMIEIAADSHSQDDNSLFIGTGEGRPFINFLSTNIYKKGKKNYFSILSPKEQGLHTDELDQYFGYDFSDDYEEVLLSNAILPDFVNPSVPLFALTPRGKNLTEDPAPELYMERLGEATGLYGQFYRTKNFPISSPGSLDLDFRDQLTHILLKENGSGDWISYAVYNSYVEAEDNYLSNGGRNCFIDRLTGRIFFAKETLKVPVGGLNFTQVLTGNEVTVLNVEEEVGKCFDDYGWVTVSNIEDNEIVKFIKIDNTRIQISGNTFSFSSYSIIPAPTLVPPDNGDLYAFYSVVTGFQRQIPSSGARYLSEEITPWLWDSQKTIAVIGKDKIYPYEITLKAIDIPFLSRTNSSFLYGPVYSGAEIVLLEGIVLDEKGIPVPNQEVSIYLEEGSGLINNESEALTLTNNEGKFYGTYNPAVGRFNWFNFKDSDIIENDGKTYLAINPEYNEIAGLNISNSLLQEPILYGIYKDDGAIGTVGEKYVFNPEENVGYPSEGAIGVMLGYLPSRFSKLTLASKYFLIYSFLKEEDLLLYMGGKVIVRADTSESPSVYNEYTYNIRDIVEIPELWWDGGTQSYIHLNDNVHLTSYAVVLDEGLEYDNPANTPVNLTAAWFFSKGDKIFDPSLLNGRKIIFAEEKSNPWKHPSSENLEPVYGPVMVESFSKTSPYSDYGHFVVDQVLPESDSTDKNKLLAGFSLIAGVSSRIRAKVYSESEYIYSNMVALEVIQNDTDRGVVENLLRTVKVPYGFRLVDGNSEVSSTLDTSTFLTVNYLPGASLSGINKYPLISYIGLNGIIYLDQNEEEKAQKSIPASVKFTINID